MLELVKGGNKYLLLNGNSCSTQLMASLFTNSKGYIAQNKYYLIYKLSPLVQHLYVKILLVIHIMVEDRKWVSNFEIEKDPRTSFKFNFCKSAPLNESLWFQKRSSKQNDMGKSLHWKDHLISIKENICSLKVREETT